MKRMSYLFIFNLHLFGCKKSFQRRIQFKLLDSVEAFMVIPAMFKGYI